MIKNPHENNLELSLIWNLGLNAKYDESNPYHNTRVPGSKYLTTPEFDAWRDGYIAAWYPLEWAVAQMIYENLGGDLVDYKVITGKDKTPFKDLEPHEHDDYLSPARKIIKSFTNAGLLEKEKVLKLIEGSLKN